MIKKYFSDFPAKEVAFVIGYFRENALLQINNAK